MASEHLQELCSNAPSIAAAYAKEDSQPIDKVIKQLIKEWKEGASKKNRKENDKIDEAERMERALACGKFPHRPSELFLKVCLTIASTLNLDAISYFADLCRCAAINGS